MIIATALWHALLICCIHQATSSNAKTPSIDQFNTKLTMFCHSALHKLGFTKTAFRTFDMKEFIKGNPQFPPNITFLTDHVTRVKKHITEQTGYIAPRTIDFFYLDVLREKSAYADELRSSFSLLQPYFDNRPKLTTALSALRTLIKDLNRPALNNFINICQESRLSAAEMKDKFLSISNLASTSNFDLARLNMLMLTMIGDFYRHAIVEGACGKTEPELAEIRSNWTDIEFAYQTQEKYLLENWFTHLSIDITTEVAQSTAPATTDRFPRHDIDIQKFLENKYFWNAFRVHIYPSNKVRDVERFLCTNTDTKTACVKGGNKIAVVHWQPLAEDKLPDANKILNRRDPPPELRQLLEQNHDKPAPSSTFTAVRAGLDIKDALQNGGEAALDKYFPKKAVMKGTTIVQESAKQARGAAKIFKGVLKFAVNVGKFLGPLAMGITGLLGVFLDEGTPNVMEEMREGFKEMSAEFRKLDTKLDQVKNEIIDAVKTAPWMAAFHLSYFERIKLPLSKLRRQFADYDEAMAGDYLEGKRSELFGYCDLRTPMDGVMTPVGLLHDMHTYFVATPSSNVRTFPDTIQNWSEAKSHRGTLLMLLTGFLMDVTDLEIMVQRCMPILVNGTLAALKNRFASLETEKVTNGKRQAYEIKRVIFELNHAQLYAWRESIQGTFDAWIPTAGADSDSMAAKLAEHLQTTYDWNLFNVLVFKHSGTGIANSGSEAHVLHPDYTKILTRGNYTYVVNWSDRDEPIIRMENFASAFDQHWCVYLGPASVLMDRASNAGVLKGTKSVFIRKDVTEHGFYSPGGIPGNRIFDPTTQNSMDTEFKEPRACCGIGGELAVSYGPKICHIQNEQKRSYCVSAERGRVRCNVMRPVCIGLVCKRNGGAVADHYTRQKYAIVINTGGGY